RAIGHSRERGRRRAGRVREADTRPTFAREVVEEVLGGRRVGDGAYGHTRPFAAASGSVQRLGPVARSSGSVLWRDPAARPSGSIQRLNRRERDTRGRSRGGAGWSSRTAAADPTPS